MYPVSLELVVAGVEEVEEEEGVADPALVLGVIVEAVFWSKIKF